MNETQRILQKLKFKKEMGDWGRKQNDSDAKFPRPSKFEQSWASECLEVFEVRLRFTHDVLKLHYFL